MSGTLFEVSGKLKVAIIFFLSIPLFLNLTLCLSSGKVIYSYGKDAGMDANLVKILVAVNIFRVLASMALTVQNVKLTFELLKGNFLNTRLDSLKSESVDTSWLNKLLLLNIFKSTAFAVSNGVNIHHVTTIRNYLQTLEKNTHDSAILMCEYASNLNFTYIVMSLGIILLCVSLLLANRSMDLDQYGVKGLSKYKEVLEQIAKDPGKICPGVSKKDVGEVNTVNDLLSMMKKCSEKIVEMQNK